MGLVRVRGVMAKKRKKIRKTAILGPPIIKCLSLVSIALETSKIDFSPSKMGSLTPKSPYLAPGVIIWNSRGGDLAENAFFLIFRPFSTHFESDALGNLTDGFLNPENCQIDP